MADKRYQQRLAEMAQELPRLPEPGSCPKLDLLPELIDTLFPEAHCESDRTEFEAYFQPNWHNPSSVELPVADSARLVLALGLKPDDHFVDLGAGRSKLPLVAHLITGVGHSSGVELSPLRHDAALAAFRALPDVRPELAAQFRLDSARPLRHYRMDLLDFPLADVTLVYFAVRCGRKSFELATQIGQRLVAERPPGARSRLVTAGVCIDESVFPTGSLTMTRVFAVPAAYCTVGEQYGLQALIEYEIIGGTGA